MRKRVKGLIKKVKPLWCILLIYLQREQENKKSKRKRSRSWNTPLLHATDDTLIIFAVALPIIIIESNIIGQGEPESKPPNEGQW